MYNLAINKCTPPPLLAPRLKIFKLKCTTPPGSNPGPAEPEADMLPTESARRATDKYQLSCLINHIKNMEVKDDWDTQISDLVKNPDGTYI